MNNKIIIIYSTINNRQDALNLARNAVEKNLAACVNILENIISIYAWQDDIKPLRQPTDEGILLREEKRGAELSTPANDDSSILSTKQDTSSVEFSNRSIEQQTEFGLIFKTSQTNKDKLCQWIDTNHPYEVPAIIIIDSESSTNFYEYINAYTQTPAA